MRAKRADPDFDVCGTRFRVHRGACHRARIRATRWRRPGMTSSLLHIIERHRPQPQRQIRLEMQGRDDLAHRQPRDVTERMRE